MTDEEQKALASDPLFQRLWPISQAVVSGRADQATLKLWRDLQESVAELLRAPDLLSPANAPEDRERVIRVWIEKYVHSHWPWETVH